MDLEDGVQTCLIHESVILGTNVNIGRFCILEKNVVIGDNNIISDYSHVGEGSKVGNDCLFGTHTFIGSNVLIGSNFTASNYCEIRSDCIIGDNVSMGSRCTLSAGTVVGDNVIMKYDFVATDTPKLGEAKRVVCVLKSGSKFGASVVIMPGLTIGENSEIGACSQVRQNIPPNEVWYGSPAVFYRKVKS